MPHAPSVRKLRYAVNDHAVPAGRAVIFKTRVLPSSSSRLELSPGALKAVLRKSAVRRPGDVVLAAEGPHLAFPPHGRSG
jgi:hypothetical protein